MPYIELKLPNGTGLCRECVFFKPDADPLLGVCTSPELLKFLGETNRGSLRTYYASWCTDVIFNTQRQRKLPAEEIRKMEEQLPGLLGQEEEFRQGRARYFFEPI